MRPLFISFILLALASFSIPVVASAQTCPTPCGAGETCVPGDGGQGICISSTGNNNQTQSTGNTTSGSVALMNPLQGGTSLESFLNNILSFVIRIGAIIVVLMLVYVGYKFVEARGEPGELSHARQMLLWTIVGALILLGAQAISIGIQQTVQALSTGG